MPIDMPEFTPVQYLMEKGGIWAKRDDLHERAGIRGGKVRACYHLIQQHMQKCYTAGIITASARKSPQMQIVARLANELGLPARLHTASGPPTAEMVDATLHHGELVQHKPGYNSVICARAELDAAAHPGWCYIPFGMESKEAMQCTVGQFMDPALQVVLQKDVKRVVVVLGSGMTAAAILWGLAQLGSKLPVVGIQIGADPIRRLDKYAPPMWRTQLTIKVSRYPYTKAIDATINGARLDPNYESKVYEHLRPGDLFWIVGIRAGLDVK